MMQSAICSLGCAKPFAWRLAGFVWPESDWVPGPGLEKMTANRMAESAASNTAGPGDEISGRVQRLLYIFQMLRELRDMAVAENAETLAYLLDMAILEASELAEAARDEAA